MPSPLPVAAPLRIAHRGYAAVGAANSLAAIGRALAIGCDAVEVDVRRRRDGQLVLDHDDGDRPGAPTLVEALALVGPTGALANLDLKEPGVARDLPAAVAEAHLRGRVVCTGGCWSALRALGLAEPGIRIGVTIPRRGGRLPAGLRRAAVPMARRRLASTLPRLVQAYGASLASVHHALVDDSVVVAARAAGIELWAWTVDDPAELARLASLRVDGICSDHPRSHGLTD